MAAKIAKQSMSKLAGAVLIAFAVAGPAWCQIAVSKTAVELAKYPGADRERVLYEGAKKEGKLVWYTSLSTYKEAAKAFEAKYPGVSVAFYRAPATSLATRILSESQARRHNVDVVETTPGAVMLLRDNKVLLPFYSPYLAEYPEGSKEKAPGGLFYSVVDRESYVGVGYNKDVIRDSDVPRTFDDLMKPVLKGKIGISAEEIGTRMVGAMVKARGEGFVRKLAAQEIKHYSMPALGLNELIVSGEIPLTFTAVDSNIRLAVARGAPLVWLPLELVPTNAGTVATFTNVQRPHAALLFIDFMIGPLGQKLLVEKFGYGSPRKDYGYKRWYAEQGLTTYDYAQSIERWNKLLLEISRR